MNKEQGKKSQKDFPKSFYTAVNVSIAKRLFALYLDGELKHGTTTRIINQEKEIYRWINRSTIVWHLEKLKKENLYISLKLAMKTDGKEALSAW